MVNQIFDAIRAGDDARVSSLVAADPANARARDDHGVSAIMQAIYQRRHAIVDRFACKQANSTSLKRLPGATPSACAACCANVPTWSARAALTVSRRCTSPASSRNPRRPKNC